MKRNIAKRSAANRKAWRTRKRMAQARKTQQYFVPADRWIEYGQPHQAEAVYLEDDGLIAQALQEAAKARTQAQAPEGHTGWPAYMTRALPNPWRKDLPPW